MPGGARLDTGARPGGGPPPSAVALRGVSKAFGAVQANRDVDLDIPKGTIHGIVGENGAGKSTLMGILYGFHSADAGDILIAGEKARIRTPTDAIAAGIGMVHQHFMLVDTFTVLENVMLGAESGPMLAASAEAARAELERLEAEYGLIVDIDAVAGGLPVGEQQRVEILKALYRGADILILDEPTGVLTPQETGQLFRILDSLRAEGVTVILITHKLREIMAVTDNVSVMRGGTVVADRKTSGTSREELAELMVGRKVAAGTGKGGAAPGEALVRASPASTASPSRCGQARSSASPASRATARASFSRPSPASARSPGAVSRWAACASTRRRLEAPPRCAPWGSPMCPRTGRGGAWSRVSPRASPRSSATTRIRGSTAAC